MMSACYWKCLKTKREDLVEFVRETKEEIQARSKQWLSKFTCESLQKIKRGTLVLVDNC